ncbi:hypothetical protein [Chamaesiphon sp.]|uniref:hypothetical protein n=1 Tax=Chamaesiphon sp. TaxID=2814140 RepID=UPI0035936239
MALAIARICQILVKSERTATELQDRAKTCIDRVRITICIEQIWTVVRVWSTIATLI